MLIIPQPQPLHVPPGTAGILTPDMLGVPRSRDQSPVVLFPSADAEADRPPSGLVRPGDVIGVPGPLTRPRIEVIMPPANRLLELLKRYYPAFEQPHALPAHALVQRDKPRSTHAL